MMKIQKKLDLVIISLETNLEEGRYVCRLVIYKKRYRSQNESNLIIKYFPSWEVVVSIHD